MYCGSLFLAQEVPLESIPWDCNQSIKRPGSKSEGLYLEDRTANRLRMLHFEVRKTRLT